MRLSPIVNNSKHIEFKFYKNDIEEVKEDKSFKFVPSFNKSLKSPSISRIEPCEISDSNASNIFIERLNKQNRLKLPLKIEVSQKISTFPKLEDRILFFEIPQ